LAGIAKSQASAFYEDTDPAARTHIPSGHGERLRSGAQCRILPAWRGKRLSEIVKQEAKVGTGVMVRHGSPSPLL